MNTTLQTLNIYFRESLRYPQAFFTMLFGWPIGMILQDLILPLIATQAINTLIEVYGAGTVDYWPVFLPYILGFIVAGVIGQVFAFVSLRMLTKFETQVRKNLEDRVYDHLIKQSLGFHGNAFSGALVSQATRFANAYVGITDTLMLQGVILVVQSLVAIAIIAFFSPLIAGAMLVWTIFFTWLNISLTKRRLPISQQAAAADSDVTSHLADTLGNIQVVKAFASEEREQTAYAAKTRDRASKYQLTWNRAVNNGTATALLMVALQLGILILSIYAVMNGQIDIGTLLLVQVYMTRLMSTLWNLGNLMKGFERSIADAREMTEILQVEPEVKDSNHSQTLYVKEGKIDLIGMDFSHADTKAGETLFTQFSLSIKAGEKIGLVGHSGSGKTTLTKLLLRFHDIDGGEIRIDGQNIKDVTQSDLRANIAYVPQEPILFHRTLRENIAYAKPDASDGEIRDAAKKAHALEFIEKLPEGFETVVGERGVKLSGGQRQRIAIARAILKDAPILILDEATSALDSESEQLIQDALTRLMKGRTSIVVAHRLSTIQNLDRIIVLDNGRIAEDGTHSALLKENGLYARLWRHQSGGFIEE